MNTRTITLGDTEWEDLCITLLTAETMHTAMANMRHATPIERAASRRSAIIIGSVIRQLDGQKEG